ncbi:O-methyltransferase [Vitiosangium sp. GDMCC 1.1324]|uniref:O-methyltransferase n=1 Tax=Vitiosangium sp. (strain GDMCC 1.1324) TaxID=2138576 RepID=UPI001E64C8F4|nr:class I SAM-dependent methyltransferase [Vitiosangium sp. GDMCC 1.1324]
MRSVLQRLHTEADRQARGLLLHYLPKLPKLLLGGRMGFTEEQIRTFYADKYLPLSRNQAAFLHLTARSMGARSIVEFGTSFGISTIWLAAVVRENGGGKVIGTELVPEKARRARAHVEEAGLSEYVEIREGNALDTLRDVEGPVDLFLNDGFPMLALEMLKLMAPKMREGGVAVANNVVTFKADYVEYMTYLEEPANGFRSMVVPFEDGLAYSIRVRGREAA